MLPYIFTYLLISGLMFISVCIIGYKFYHEDKNKKGDFITLTFDDQKSCPLLSLALSKRVLQNYFKRLRKAGNKIKYFACGEYGENHGRAHYHAIIIRGEDEPNYQKHWNMGNVKTGTVTRASARYCTGYLTKSNAIPKGKEKWPPFQLQSQGIGLEWAKKNRHNITKELSWIPRYLAEKTGAKIPNSNLPTKLFTSAETLSQRHRNAQAQIDTRKN